MTVNGSYEVTATSTKDCGCKETVTIHRGMDDISLMPGEDNPLYNVDNEVYELSTETHITDGGLISLDRLSDKENVLNADGRLCPVCGRSRSCGECGDCGC